MHLVETPSSGREDPSQQVVGHVTCTNDVRFSTEKAMKHQGRYIQWLAPAASVLNSKWAKSFSASALASAATLPEGGWWPQEKLMAAGLAADPYCKACQDFVPDSKDGAHWHRMRERAAHGDAFCSRCPIVADAIGKRPSQGPLVRRRHPVTPRSARRRLGTTSAQWDQCQVRAQLHTGTPPHTVP